MTVKGTLQDFRTGAPLNGFIKVVRNGATELTVETIGGSFIIEGLIPEDILIIEVAKYKTEKFLVSELSDADNIFYLSKQFDTRWLPLALVATAGAYYIGNDKKRVGEITGKQVLTFGGIGLGFLAVKKVFEKLGIFKSADEKNLENEAQNPASAWSPNFYQNKPINEPWTYTIDTTTATNYSKELYNAFGAFNDCEECAKAVIKRLRTKANVSFLADIFYRIYGQDLLTFLIGGLYPQDRLSDADVNELVQYVNKLPNY